MQISQEFQLLVINGSWNRHIFQKKWIEKYLLPKEDFDIEVSVGPIDTSHRISVDRLRVEFHSQRIAFIPRKDDFEIYQEIEDLASKIAEYLPHTPVVSYGVNFVFTAISEEYDSDYLKLNDTEALKGYCGPIIKSQHTNTINYDDHVLNLKVADIKKDNNIFFDFNFHYLINNLIEFKNYIYKHPISDLYNRTVSIMDNVYEIDINKKESIDG